MPQDREVGSSEALVDQKRRQGPGSGFRLRLGGGITQVAVQFLMVEALKQEGRAQLKLNKSAREDRGGESPEVVEQ